VRNVLIVNADQILGAVVSNLLMAEQEIALANFTPLCPTEIIEQLRTQDPDVLILANNLVNESVLQQILAKAKDDPQFTIIVIDVADNQVHLNGSQHFLIESSSDLVQIVLSGYQQHSQHKARKSKIRHEPVKHRNWTQRLTQNPVPNL